MNTKLFKLLTAGTFVALLSACGDNVVEYSDDSSPVQTKATLNVVVRDAITQTPLNGVTVTLLSTGETASTGEKTGTFSFKNVSVGDNYTVLVEKEGYASYISTATITSVSQGQSSNGDAVAVSNNIFIAGEATERVELYPLTSSLDGIVHYEDINGVNKVAAGAEVRIELIDPLFVKRVFIETVKDDGKFSFSRLPAVGTDYVIYIMEITNNHTYRTTDFPATDLSGASLLNGSPSHIAEILKYKRNDMVATFELMDYKTIIKSDETLNLTFNSAIDAAKFDPTWVSFKNISGGTITTIPVVKVVKGETLELTPLDKWPSYIVVGGSVTSGFRVCFGNLKSVNNITPATACTGIIEVETASIADKAVGGFVQADTSDWDSDVVKLKWNKLANATGYRIYAKVREGIKKGEFVYLQNNELQLSGNIDTTIYINFGGTCTSNSDDTYTYDCPANNGQHCETLGFPVTSTTSSPCPFTRGKGIEFLIQAYNKLSETNLKNAAVAASAQTLVVKDTKKPRIAGNAIIPGALGVELGSIVHSGEPNTNTYTPTGFVKFGYDRIYDKYSYTWGLRQDIAGFASNSLYAIQYYNIKGLDYVRTEPGLDSASFGYASDLGYHLSNASVGSLSPDGIVKGCTEFDEPMDTTMAILALVPQTPTVAPFLNDLPARVTVDKKWSADAKQLCFTFNVAAVVPSVTSVSTANVAAAYSLSGLQDKYGNPLEIDHKGTIGKKSTLDFRIYSIGYADPTPVPIIP